MNKPKKPAPKGRLVKLTIDELSGVDKPCHAPATVAIMKRSTAQCGACGSFAADDDTTCPQCDAPMKKRGTEPTTTDEVPSVVIAARANSTRPDATPKVASNTQEIAKMTDAEITTLTKRAERAERLATLTDAQRSHFAKLAPSDAEAFAAKTHSEREAVLADIAKADEVVYVSKSDGTQYRKSDDQRLVNMAKREDANAIILAKAVEDAHVARFSKRAAEELGHLPGDNVAKVALLRAVEAIPDEAVRKSATEVLKAGDAAMSGGYASTGTSSVAPEGTNAATQALEVAVAKYQADHKLPSYALALADATAKDPAIRELWNAAL